jgi:hypothetical protein
MEVEDALRGGCGGVDDVADDRQGSPPLGNGCPAFRLNPHFRVVSSWFVLPISCLAWILNTVELWEFGF